MQAATMNYENKAAQLSSVKSIPGSTAKKSIFELINMFTGHYDLNTTNKKISFLDALKGHLGLLYKSKQNGGIKHEASNQIFFKMAYLVVLWKYKAMLDVCFAYMSNGFKIINPYYQSVSEKLSCSELLQILRTKEVLFGSDYEQQPFEDVINLYSKEGSPLEVLRNKQIPIEERVDRFVKEASQWYENCLLLRSSMIGTKPSWDISTAYMGALPKAVQSASNKMKQLAPNKRQSKYATLKDFKKDHLLYIDRVEAYLEERREVPLKLFSLYLMLAEMLFKDKYSTFEFVGQDYREKYDLVGTTGFLKGPDELPASAASAPDDLEQSCNVAFEICGESLCPSAPIPLPVFMASDAFDCSKRITKVVLLLFRFIHKLIREFLQVEKDASSVVTSNKLRMDPSDVIITFAFKKEAFDELLTDMNALKGELKTNGARSAFDFFENLILCLPNSKETTDSPDIYQALSKERLTDLMYSSSLRRLEWNMKSLAYGTDGYNSSERADYLEMIEESGGNAQSLAEELDDLYRVDIESGMCFYESQESNGSDYAIEEIKGALVVSDMPIRKNNNNNNNNNNSEMSGDEGKKHLLIKTAAKIRQQEVDQINSKHGTNLSIEEYEVINLKNGLLAHSTI